MSRPRDKLHGCNEMDNLTFSDSDVSDIDNGHGVSSHGGTPPLLSIVAHMDQVLLIIFGCLLFVIKRYGYSVHNTVEENCLI